MRDRTEIVAIAAPVLIEVVSVLLMFGIAIIWVALRAHAA